MPPLTVTSFVLSLLLASPVMYFLVAGAKTFNVPELADAGAAWGQVSFLSESVAPIWIGLHHGMDTTNGLIGGAIAVLSVSLYEWTRWTVAGRNFFIGLSGEVPVVVCEAGPYRYFRHPFYLSYMLAFLAMVVAGPTILTAAVFGCNVLLFVYMALDDERTLAKSPLAKPFAEYKSRVGTFLVLPRRRSHSPASL
jgi:protein-S-isoprenylcysteine O-methyltransferase Ste14